jgi:hypothetical protein
VDNVGISRLVELDRHHARRLAEFSAQQGFRQSLQGVTGCGAFLPLGYDGPTGLSSGGGG